MALCVVTLITTHMSKIIKYLIVGVLAVGLIYLTGQSMHTPKHSKTDAQAAPLKIGSILPLSGDFAPFGEEINRGAELAISELQKNGVEIAYINQDDHSTAIGSTNAANYLINNAQVDVAFTATVQEVKPSAPLFNEARTPLIAVWDSNEVIKSAGPFVYTSGFGTEAAGAKMARYIFQDLGLQTVAIVNQKDEWSGLIATSFAEEFNRLGGVVVLSEEVSPETRDFKTVLAKIKSADPDAIYAPLLPQAGGVFLKQSYELKVGGQIAMADSFSQDDIDLAKGAAENVIFTNLYANNTSELLARYQQTYGMEAKELVFVSFGYDVIYTILEAQKISEAKGISLDQALKQVDIVGYGERINFAGTQAAEREEKIYRVQNGEIHLAQD